MFRCAITKRLSKPGAKCNKIVVATRSKTYLNYNFEGEEIVSHGSEIVMEVDATDEGLAVWDAMSETDKATKFKIVNL